MHLEMDMTSCGAFLNSLSPALTPPSLLHNPSGQGIPLFLSLARDIYFTSNSKLITTSSSPSATALPSSSRQSPLCNTWISSPPYKQVLTLILTRTMTVTSPTSSASTRSRCRSIPMPSTGFGISTLCRCIGWLAQIPLG